jgi:diadenosine tetraphosphatase ApaH/serine/threonine PP2A family protein phosphatase
VKVAVLSDVHGNLAALEAVLADIDSVAPDELWCLGDLVGYNARPNECVDLVRERVDLSLVGNHDLVVRGDLSLEEFSSDAAAAARWSREVLGAEQRTYLRSLAPLGDRDGVSVYHASPRDPIWEYVVTPDVAIACLARQRTDLALVGHSHVALALHLSAGSLHGGVATAGATFDLEGRRCLLNPGSVGQPRDRDPRAAWLLLDLDERKATFHRVDYDIERTQREILEAGLPARLAERLERGE